MCIYVSMCIYIYIYIHIGVCIYIYIYIYVHTHCYSSAPHGPLRGAAAVRRGGPCARRGRGQAVLVCYDIIYYDIV